MRARLPDIESYVENDGVKIAYEVFGEGPATIVFVPIDTIVQSRAWKAQVPYLSRFYRVITIDPPGNGRSGRSLDSRSYDDDAIVADALAVMDAEGVDQAVLVGVCVSAWNALVLASRHPERALGVVAVAPFVPYLTKPPPHKASIDFEIERPSYEGWQKINRNYWADHFPDFANWFFGELLPEPHSSKVHEDVVGWALDAGRDVLLAEHGSKVSVTTAEETDELLRAIRCPVLAIHGTGDLCQPRERTMAIIERTNGQLLSLEGAGHLPMAREPIVVNHAIRAFVAQVAPTPPPVRRWTHPLSRQRRVLFLSSPIGLGHSRRDVAIADELRRLRPEIQVDWLAQHPLTELLERRGEHIHPASAFLANESSHFESECAEHDLHAFQAVRRMDEILVNNFMVFSDVVDDSPYDAWVGDEAWELDYFLHENPELKRAPFAWLTDFVGWIPMPDGGAPEAALAADYNAEMVEQVARFPRLRDLSLFVGNADDVVPGGLGPDLPQIRNWTEQNFDFVGYVSGFDPAGVADREALRADLGYADGEKVCVVTVGGSGAGLDLLRRVAAAFPAAGRAVPGLRMVMVTGPRIDPASVGAPDGVEVHGYVHDLYRHLAACDLAIVQGGLTTTMELTANQRPFLYVPLRHHFEQNFHVRHRLDRYRAGHCLDYDEINPDSLAAAMVEELDRPLNYRPVETDGARRAAERISALV